MRFLGLMLVMTGGAAALVVPASAPRKVEPPQAEEIPLVAWSDLADRPCRWLGRNVRLRMQVESRPADWNPYLTRFGTGQFDAVQGWTDEQFPWLQADFDAPLVRVFARKGNPNAALLQEAKPYTRFEVTGVVREVLLDLPWIEVVDVRPMSDAISEASVIHAARAIDLMGERTWDMAQLELDQAMAAPLPESALIELARLHEECVQAQANGLVRPGARSSTTRR